MPTRLTAQGHLLSALHRAEVRYDAPTGEHSVRVGVICWLVAQELGLSPGESDAVASVGVLHDLGKLGIPHDILARPGPLTEAELVEVQRHPIVGGQMILAISPALGPLASAIRAHHERWNGSGYPDGLAGTDIPLFGRIAAVADVFDAVTHPRSYRPSKLSHDEGIEFVVDRANRDFDPRVVRAFARAIGPSGTARETVTHAITV